jgi:hypothetical protein
MWILWAAGSLFFGVLIMYGLFELVNWGLSPDEQEDE